MPNIMQNWLSKVISFFVCLFFSVHVLKHVPTRLKKKNPCLCWSSPPLEKSVWTKCKKQTDNNNKEKMNKSTIPNTASWQHRQLVYSVLWDLSVFLSPSKHRKGAKKTKKQKNMFWHKMKNKRFRWSWAQVGLRCEMKRWSMISTN